MSKSSTAVRGFFSSLILLIVALTVFLVIMLPRSHPEAKVVATVAENIPAPSIRRNMRDMRRAPVVAAVEPAAPAAKPVVKAPKPDAADGSADTDVQKAIDLIDAGNIQDALTILDAVLKRDPRNEQALVEMAMVQLLDLKQPDQALGYLQRVMEVNAQNQIVMSELVSLYEEQGKVDEGLGFLQDLQSKNPGSPELNYGIGQLLTLQGKDADAVTYLERAAEGAPDQEIRAYRDLGEAYARSGDPDKAVDSFDRSVTAQEHEIADKTARGLPVQFAEERLAYTKIDLARELLKRGDSDQAQQVLDEAKVVMPTDESVTALQNIINHRRSG